MNIHKIYITPIFVVMAVWFVVWLFGPISDFKNEDGTQLRNANICHLAVKQGRERKATREGLPKNCVDIFSTFACRAVLTSGQGARTHTTVQGGGLLVELFGGALFRFAATGTCLIIPISIVLIV